jgi:anti-anti-sigma factor
MMEITCRRLGSLTILDLRGRCIVGPDDAEVSRLRSAIMRLILEGRVDVAANLAALKSIDARCLGELVFAHRTLMRAGGALTVVAPNCTIRRMLAVTRLDTVLRLVDSETELVAEVHEMVGGRGWRKASIA